MTPSERRIRTEVRYWATNLAVVVALVGAASSRVTLTAISFCIVAIFCLWQAHKGRGELRRPDAEAKQEEWL